MIRESLCSQIKVMFLKIHCLLVLMMFAPFACLQAQDDNIPIRPDLERNAEQWLIKIGMINKKKPPKVKFGDFYTEQREGKQAGKEQLRFSSPEDTDLSHEFSFTLVNKENSIFEDTGISSTDFCSETKICRCLPNCFQINSRNSYVLAFYSDFCISNNL